MSYLEKKCCMSCGVGVSDKGLPSFDKALLDAGVGNYNLVRLSSILPAKCEWIDVRDISRNIPEGSLLPTAYSTITSNNVGDTIVSVIGVGIPEDENNVGVIMEYSVKNISKNDAENTLVSMIEEAFEIRGWALKEIKFASVSVTVEKESNYTTFACIAEW